MPQSLISPENSEDGAHPPVAELAGGMQQQMQQQLLHQQMQQQLRAPLFEDKVVDYVFELAEVKDKKVNKDALQKAVEALDEE